MTETNNNTIQDSSPSGSLTVGALKALVAEVVENVQGANGHREPLLTAEELAQRLKVPVSWVYEQSRLRNIPTHRFGRYIRFNLQEVIENQKKTKYPLDN